MSDIKVFENKEFGNLRTVILEDNIWFVGKDVAAALGYGEGKSLANAVANHVDDEDKGVTKMMTLAVFKMLPLSTSPVSTPLSYPASSHRLKDSSIG